MTAPKFYAAVRPSGRIASVETSQRQARDVAAQIWATGRNRRVYGKPNPSEWSKAKAAGWTVERCAVIQMTPLVDIDF